MSSVIVAKLEKKKKKSKSKAKEKNMKFLFLLFIRSLISWRFFLLLLFHSLTLRLTWCHGKFRNQNLMFLIKKFFFLIWRCMTNFVDSSERFGRQIIKRRRKSLPSENIWTDRYFSKLYFFARCYSSSSLTASFLPSINGHRFDSFVLFLFLSKMRFFSSFSSSLLSRHRHRLRLRLLI